MRPVRAPPAPGRLSPRPASLRGARLPLAGSPDAVASSATRDGPRRARPCLTRRGCRTWPSMCSACSWVRSAPPGEGRVRAGRGRLPGWAREGCFWAGTGWESRLRASGGVCRPRTPGRAPAQGGGFRGAGVPLGRLHPDCCVAAAVRVLPAGTLSTAPLKRCPRSARCAARPCPLFPLTLLSPPLALSVGFGSETRGWMN